MAENGPRQPQGAVDAAGGNGSLEPPVDSVDSNATEESTSQDEPRPEDALVQALRRFIREESQQVEDSGPQKIGLRQAFALLLFSIDIAIIYSQVQRALETPLFQEILKVLPWVLGATAVGFSDKVRRMLVDQARHLKWVIVFGAILMPLLVLQMRIFSMRLRVNAESVTVTPDDRRVEAPSRGNMLYTVIFPDWNGYSVTIEDTHNEDSAPSKLYVGHWGILRGTLAQIPLLGGLFGRKETAVTPLYYVTTKTSQGNGHVNVEGWFQDGFLSSTSCARVKASKPDHKAVQCTVKEGIDALKLPKGWYDFTVFRDGCRRSLPSQEVKESGNREIKVDELCGN